MGIGCVVEMMVAFYLFFDGFGLVCLFVRLLGFNFAFVLDLASASIFAFHVFLEGLLTTGCTKKSIGRRKHSRP